MLCVNWLFCSIQYVHSTDIFDPPHSKVNMYQTAQYDILVYINLVTLWNPHILRNPVLQHQYEKMGELFAEFYVYLL